MKSVSDLSIIAYPHPALRVQAKLIKRVDTRLEEVVKRMFELMYEHKGVGLAATQVGLPLQLFVMNPSGRADEGEQTVLINPVLSKPRGSEVAEEGCLSLPNIHGNVTRAKTIHVSAFTIEGREIDRDFTQYEARIVQHETDHLQGRLFIDRLIDREVAKVQDELDTLATNFHSRQRLGQIGDDASLLAELSQWESEYC